jgi:outer membrane protein
LSGLLMTSALTPVAWADQPAVNAGQAAAQSSFWSLPWLFPHKAAPPAASPVQPAATSAPPVSQPAARSGFHPLGWLFPKHPAPQSPEWAMPAPRTLQDALALAYETNPQLRAERAKLRATDENLPAALAGWRPSVSISGNAGRRSETSKTPKPDFVNNYYAYDNISTTGAQVTVTQYLYHGGHTTAATHQAENSIRAERAQLIAQEEQTFSSAVSAYVAVIQDSQLVGINKANEQVLGGELKAITARFRVGELTTTDVAEAQSALAQAIAQREIAEGNLQSARATFTDVIGAEPANNLVPPQPAIAQISSDDDAASLAVANNPTVIADRFAQAQAKDAIDVAFSALMPTVSVQASANDISNPSLGYAHQWGGQATATLNVPLYQGGAEYATVRQARQSYQQATDTTLDGERTAREQAVQGYETLIAAKAAIESSKINVKAAEIALEGIERQALVGTATTQDVLIQEQNLLTAQTNLVNNIASMITASYTLTAAIGRLTARDLALNVPLYDETAYYNEVRHRLWGTGDYATDQPGR